MNTNPENENINDVVTKSTDENTADAFSTVFSNPTEHKKSAENLKRKKLLPTVIAYFLIVAILVGGTVAVIKLIPEKEDGDNTSSSIEDIEVLSLDSNNFKSVNITNTNGTFKLYSKEDKTDTTSNETETASSDDSSETTKTVTWFVEGYDETVLSSSSIAYIPDSIAILSASREVTERTVADCGLENSKIKAVVTDSENKEFTVLIGDESPDKSGYYLKLSNSDKIYVVASDVKDTLNFTLLSLAETNSLPAFDLTDVASTYKTDEGAFSTFDKLTIIGKNITEPLVIEQITDEATSQISLYRTVSPSIRSAENLDDIISIYTNGISVTGAYALDVTPKTLSALGLDNPDFTAKMEIDSKSLTFKFKEQPDGDYAVISDGSVIVKKVSADTVSSFINNKTSDFYGSWVCLNFIDDLDGFTFKSGNTEYSFSIAKNTDEESEETYIVKYNGKTIKSADFQDFYQDCISLSAADFSTDNVTGEAAYKMVFKYKNTVGEDQTVEFRKFSETKYEYSVNGEALGKVTSASLKALENSLKEILNKN